MKHKIDATINLQSSFGQCECNAKYPVTALYLCNFELNVLENLKIIENLRSLFFKCQKP